MRHEQRSTSLRETSASSVTPLRCTGGSDNRRGFDTGLELSLSLGGLRAGDRGD